MAKVGGYREGAGRKKGSANKKTREIANKAAEQGLTPLEYMLEVMRSPMPPEVADLVEAMKREGRLDIEIVNRLVSWHSMRFEAAKGAAPYIHPRLNATTMTGPNNGPLQVEIVRFADQTAE